MVGTRIIAFWLLARGVCARRHFGSLVLEVSGVRREDQTPAQSAKLARDGLLFGLLEFALDFLGVGVEFLLDRLSRSRERLVELFFDPRLSDHDQRALSAFEQLSELLGVIARHTLFQVPSDAAGETADRRRAENRRREQDADERSDRDATPRAVLRRLLMLLNVDLPLVVLPDQSYVVSAHELRRVGFEQHVVVVQTIVVAPICRCIDKNR